MKRFPYRDCDQSHTIKRKVIARTLPPDPPEDLAVAYRKNVLRLMNGDITAWTEIHALRAEEARRLRGGR